LQSFESFALLEYKHVIDNVIIKIYNQQFYFFGVYDICVTNKDALSLSVGVRRPASIIYVFKLSKLWISISYKVLYVPVSIQKTKQKNHIKVHTLNKRKFSTDRHNNTTLLRFVGNWNL
jgi:hypothetical protein